MDRIITESAFGSGHAPDWRIEVGSRRSLYLRTLNGVPFFVNNEAEAAVLMKERQPIAPSVLIPALAAVVIISLRIRT